MAYALVGAVGAATQGATGAAVTPAWDAGASRTAGNLLIAWISVTGVATLPVTPSGWTIAKQVAGTSCSATVYFKVAAGADAAPTIALITSGVIAAQLAEFSGNHAEPFDQTGSAASISSPVTATFGAPDVATGGLIVACGADFRSAARTPNDTWTGTNWTATQAGNNNAASSANHYSNAYSLATTGSASADTAVMTVSVTTSLTGLAVAAASFVAASVTKTRLFLRHADVSTDTTYQANVGIVYTTLGGGSANRIPRLLGVTRRNNPSTVYVTAVAGPTNGIEVAPTFSPPPSIVAYVSRPLSAAVTVSGAIRFSLWAFEASAADNAAINCSVYKVSGLDGTLSLVHKTARSVEVALAYAVNDFTETPAAGVAFARGDRIMLVPFFDDAGTMAQPGTDNLSLGSGGNPGDRDSFVAFSETISFEGPPAGTQVFLTNGAAASGKEAWTGRGSGVVSAVTNTATGPTSGIQVTASAGGAAVEWYTRPLQAMTLSGPVLANVRGLESSSSANASLVCEIAVTNGDGSSPVVWATNAVAWDATTTELTVSESALSAWLQGADTAILAGQRLRVRLYVDDAYTASFGSDALTTLAAGFTVTVFYASTSGGASGDSFLTFSSILTEQVAAQPPYVNPYPPLLAQ